MREKRLTTEPPVITEYNFEDLLATDDLLVDYFNEFLSLPVFAQPIKFNRIYGNFEVIDQTSIHLKQQLKNIKREYKSKQSYLDSTRKLNHAPDLGKTSLPKDFDVDPNYTVMCLNRKQGLQWVKKERLPIFLASDCYFEYRLAKLLSQVKLSSSGIALRIDSRYHPWPLGEERHSPSHPSPHSEDEYEAITRKFFASLGQASYSQTKDWFTLAKQSQLTTPTTSFSRPLAWGPVHHQDLKVFPVGSSSQGADVQKDTYNPLVSKDSSSTFPLTRPSEAFSNVKVSEDLKHADEEYSVSFAESPSPTPIRVYIDQFWEQEKQKEWQEMDVHTIDEDKETAIETIELSEKQHSPTVEHLEEFAAIYVDRLLKDTVTRLTNQPTEELFQKKGIYKGFQRVVHSLPHSSTSPSSDQLGSSTSFSSGEQDYNYNIPEFRDEEVCLSSESDDEEISKINWYISHRYINSRKKFEKFKSFLKGTLGEKNWWLWMDIERLRSIKDPKRQQRHLNRMRKLFLVTGEDHYMPAEILLKLGLRDGNQWNASHLYHVQAQVVKPLLLYWGPRYCLSRSASGYVSDALKLWRDRHLRPKKNINPFPQTITLLPLRARSCVPKISPSSSQKPGSSSPRSSPKKDKQPHRLLSAGLVEQRKNLKNKPSSAVSKSESTGKLYTSDKRRLSQSSNLSDSSQCLRTKQDRRDSREELHKHDITLGGSTTELMLQALNLESRAGYYFTRFCELSRNQLWKNNINFWSDLQNFHHLFHQETLQPFKLGSQAQFLYATYLGPGTTMDIGVPQTVKSEIYHELDPPFDDLFDSAEEHALTLLLNAWTKMVELDNRAYEQVELEEETRKLDLKKLRTLYQEYVNTIKKRAYKTGFPSSTDSRFSPLPYFSFQPSRDSSFLSSLAFGVSDIQLHRDSDSLLPHAISEEKNLWEKVPDKYQDIDLGFLSQNKAEMEFFHQTLTDHFDKTDLRCWEDIEAFRKMNHKEKRRREEKSKDIKKKYLNKKYFFGPNSPATKEEQDKIMQLSGGWGQMLQETLPSSVLPEIQKVVRKRIEKKTLPLFLATEQFNERHKHEKSGIVSPELTSSHEWQDSLSSSLDLTTPAKLAPKRPAFEGLAEITSSLGKDFDDQLLNLKKKKYGAWKDMDSKWLSPSKDMIAFRKALGNPLTAKQFQRFISLTDDYLENGLLFWLEVQRYKDLCHSHCDESVIQNKISTIINCFINSTVPPTLQIDIPPEQAEKIIEHRKELGPYIFREAQMTIFNTLFKLWPEFCALRGHLSSDKLLPLLGRKKSKQMKQMQKRLKEVARLTKGEEGTAAEMLRRRYEDVERRRTDRFTLLASKQEDKKKAALRGVLHADESMYSGKSQTYDRSLYGYNASGTWSYSKYLEAVEQEKMLLKIQDDLEKKSSSTFYTDMSSAFTAKTDSTKPTGKTYSSSIHATK